jgi:hypothetical protein
VISHVLVVMRLQSRCVFVVDFPVLCLSRAVSGLLELTFNIIALPFRGEARC